MDAITPDRRKLLWGGIAFAIVFPSIVTWAYFFQAADAAEAVQQTVMATLKLLQFAFPLVWVRAVLKERIVPARPHSAGLAIGAAFGAAVTVAGWLLFDLRLRDTSWFAAALGPIQAKVAGFGLDAGWKFLALAAFYSVFHSLLEEYYWRWFVFGQLRRVTSLGPAIVVASLGFMAHHVLVLSTYFGWWTAPTLLLSAAVAVGGAFWAWLYARTGSLYGSWLSHAIVDAGIFAVGYALLSPR